MLEKNLLGLEIPFVLRSALKPGLKESRGRRERESAVCVRMKEGKKCMETDN